MAHQRTQSQPFQYRYRPNAPVRAATTVPLGSFKEVEYQSPPSTNYSTSHLFNSPPSKDTQSTTSYMHVNPEADDVYHSSYVAGFGVMDHTAFTFASGFQPVDFSPMLSPHAPSWVSSNSSVTDDSCSGSWSSSASSMSFSPEPQYQVPFVENASWPPQSHSSYFPTNCVSMQEVFSAPAVDPESGINPDYFSQMGQSWQYQYMGNGLLPVYESTEYSSSSRGSPESVSEQASRSSETVATVRPLSDDISDIKTEASIASSPSMEVKEVESTSTQPRAKSQFEGQILEFSAPMAQAKSKGAKSAALPCPLAGYGCTSSFISKNEWKRHINTQHLRLEAWLCDQCPKRDNKREFNRKDLFIQHLKRMHPSACPTHSPKPSPSKSKTHRSGSKGDKITKPSKGDDLDPTIFVAEQRCHKILRQPPAESACLFCSTTFSGRGSWEARIEHVAKHMEQYKKDGSDVPDPKTWRNDQCLEQWLSSEGVISKARQRWSIV